MPTISVMRKLSEEIVVDEGTSSVPRRRTKKSLKPTSDMLRMLNLNYGSNKITYRVRTDL